MAFDLWEKGFQMVHLAMPYVLHFLLIINIFVTSHSNIFFSCFSVPTYNVASTRRQATVIEGVSRNRNDLIDGSIKNYDLESGYTCHQVGSGSITIQLAQPYIIGSMKYVKFAIKCYFLIL